MKVEVIWSADRTTQTETLEADHVSTQIFNDGAPTDTGGRSAIVILLDTDRKRLETIQYASVYRIRKVH